MVYCSKLPDWISASWFNMKKRPREVSQSETAKYFEWIMNDLTPTCVMRVSRLWSSRSPVSPFLRHLEWSRRYCGSQLHKRASVAIACEYSHLSSLSFCQQRRLYSQAILARKWSKTYPYICANPVISVDPNWVLNSWNWLPSTRRANTYKITKSHKMRFLHPTWNKTSKTTNNLATF